MSDPKKSFKEIHHFTSSFIDHLTFEPRDFVSAHASQGGIIFLQLVVGILFISQAMLVFSPVIIHLVWYIQLQLFTSVVNVNLAVSRLG